MLGKHFLLPEKKECIPNDYWQFQKNFLYIPVYSVSTKNFSKEIRLASKKITYFSGDLLKQRIDLILNRLKYIINDEDSGTYLFNFHMQVTCRVDFYENHLSDMLTALLQCYTALKPNYPKLNVSFCLKMTHETLFINYYGIKLGDPLSEEFDYEASTYFNFFENILEEIK